MLISTPNRLADFTQLHLVENLMQEGCSIGSTKLMTLWWVTRMCQRILLIQSNFQKLHRQTHPAISSQQLFTKTYLEENQILQDLATGQMSLIQVYRIALMSWLGSLILRKILLYTRLLPDNDFYFTWSAFQTSYWSIGQNSTRSTRTSTLIWSWSSLEALRGATDGACAVTISSKL